ncbi:hypothetical protein [Corynebacterium pygosceleis]|uniref:ABC transporter substrate-binding protein n=1 Tax=Corynebacterium pygosceleis TaxID=2800406 RepID=A0A9Q4C7U5_9CORY|nr:hypothetical protein [Corynebacterium pygosceleis]MCK7637496.1 hypothetical protein [Corynebacterium pygosceleis]MCK7674683.1 hypothetical protein [Corynebacterium pygosceleis]MCL0119728.1 hypothetical protein [Corynebacterium pygosceleis]MCX7468175.1 hypothetical protein [Corynebacterium pygosceleis]
MPTRRTPHLAVALVAALTLAACNSTGDDTADSVDSSQAVSSPSKGNSGDGGESGGSGDSSASADETRTVHHEVGTAEVPVSPMKVVAFDDNAGIAALAAGIRPSVVYTSSSDVGSDAILEAAGVEIREAAALELPPMEEIQALGADMFVGTGAVGPVGQQFDKLNDIAGTVVLPITGPWEELVRSNGELLGADPGVTDRQIEAIRSRLEAAAAASDDRTISLLGNTFGTSNFTMPPAAPSSTLIKEAGFDRPEFQRQEAEGYAVTLSDELLPQQDADILVLPEGTYYDADALLALPTARTLQGEQVRTLAELWLVATPFAFYGIATDLEAIATGKPVTTEDTIGDLWDDFAAETEI